MADNSPSTDPFNTWSVGSVDSWVANTYSQPLQLDPHGITQQYPNVNHYHYNVNPAGSGQERYVGSINKTQIEGMPPGRPKKEEVKPKFTRAPMTYGEYKRMRDAFINGSDTVYPGIASYTQYPAPPPAPVPKSNLNNESEKTWDEIESPARTMVYQTPYNGSESQALPDEHLFRVENRPNDRNSTDRLPCEPELGEWNRSDYFPCDKPKLDEVQSYQSDRNNDRNTNSRPRREPRPGDWDCSKCSANNFSNRTECFRCHEPKGDDVHSYQGDSYNDRNTNSRPPREPRPGDWNCSKCKANNFSHRTECFRCHESKVDDDQSYQGGGNNDRNTSSRPPREPRSGDWNCSKCSANNFSHRTECFRCHEPKGDDVQSYQRDRNSRPPREPRPGDWNCTKCSANNFPHRTECFRCHEPKGDDVQSYQRDSNNNRNSRPPREPRPGDWNCSKCSANNFPHRTECFRCHEPKGDDVQSYQIDRNNDRHTNSSPPREPRPGDWNCSKCSANNFSHRTDCFRCHESKGDDFQSGGSPSRNDEFGNKSWAGGNNAGNNNVTAQDEDDWDDDEPKVSNPQIEKRKLSTDIYRDDKLNDSPGPISYGYDKSYDSREPVPKKRKLSDDWDDDDDEENEPKSVCIRNALNAIHQLEEVLNTDDKCDDRSSVGENNEFGTPDENNFEEKDDVDDENNVEEKQDVDDVNYENNVEEKQDVDGEHNFEEKQNVEEDLEKKEENVEIE